MWLEEGSRGSLELSVVVVPRASRTRICGVHQDRLKVQLSAPPVDGAANEALIELLASTLGVKKSAVELVSGQTGKRKHLRITGVARGEALARLLSDG